MGNYRFRLSDMIPNAWFYKLKDMGKKPKPKPRTQNNSKKPKPQQQQQQQQQQFIQHRNSYYFTSSNEPYFKPSTIDRLYNSPTNPKFSDVHFPESPRKSSKRRPRRRPNKPNSSKPVTSSISAGCSCKASIDSSAKTDSTPNSSSSSSSPDPNLYSEPVSSWSSSSSCKLSSSATDIIIDVERLETKKNFGLDSISEIELPPILTKPVQKNQIHCPKIISPRSYLISPKLKLRTISPRIRANSPRIRANRKQAAAKNYTNTTTLTRRKKHVLESFAIVKSSFDPQRDFRDSMIEMIVENNLWASKDLEELLACYLSLNSNEYHDLIVKVFEQIWFDLIDIQIKCNIN